MRSGLHGVTIPLSVHKYNNKTWFNAVRTGLVSGIYPTSAAATAQTTGVRNCEYKRFRCRHQAQAYIDALAAPVRTDWSPGQLTIYTDGSHDPRRRKAGWGFVNVSPTPKDAPPLNTMSSSGPKGGSASCPRSRRSEVRRFTQTTLQSCPPFLLQYDGWTVSTTSWPPSTVFGLSQIVSM
jgi:hypothetical protein